MSSKRGACLYWYSAKATIRGGECKMLLAQLLCVGILAAAVNAENFTWLGLATSGTSMQPPARHSAAMGAWGDAFYMFGGLGNKDSNKNGTKLLGEITVNVGQFTSK